MLFLKLLFSGYVFSVVASHFASMNWFFDLFTHFKIQYIWVGILFAIAMFFTKHWLYLFLSIFLVTILIYQVFSVSGKFSTTPEQNRETSNQFSITTYNKYYKNNNIPEIIDLLNSEDAHDVFIIHEIREDEIKELIDNLQNHKFSTYIEGISSTRNRSAVFSKMPLLNSKTIILDLEHQARRLIKTEVKTSNGRIFVLYAVHPKVPMYGKAANTRNAELRKIGEFLKEEDEPYIIAGDFNCTVFSPHLQNLMESTSTKYLSSGKLPLFTWPSQLLVKPLQIGIDHILISEEFEIRNVQRGSPLGADHYPVSATLSF